MVDDWEFVFVYAGVVGVLICLGLVSLCSSYDYACRLDFVADVKERGCKSALNYYCRCRDQYTLSPENIDRDTLYLDHINPSLTFDTRGRYTLSHDNDAFVSENGNLSSDSDQRYTDHTVPPPYEHLISPPPYQIYTVEINTPQYQTNALPAYQTNASPQYQTNALPQYQTNASPPNRTNASPPPYQTYGETTRSRDTEPPPPPHR